MGWIGPLFGTRYRFEVAQTVGGWNVTQLLADYRRYIPLKGPVLLAARALYVGEKGPDADRQRYFLGSTDLVRGHTSGSYYRNECEIARRADPRGQLPRAGPDDRHRDRRRQPRASLPDRQFVPRYRTTGVALHRRRRLRGLRRRLEQLEHGGVLEGPERHARAAGVTRTPVTTLGFGARINLFGYMILRFDLSYPQGRGIPAYWTISIGPPF